MTFYVHSTRRERKKLDSSTTWRPSQATHFPSGQLTPWSNTNPGGSCSESRPRPPLTKAAYSPEPEDSPQHQSEKLDASMNHFASWPRLHSRRYHWNQSLIPTEITDSASRPRPQRFTAPSPSANATNHIPAETTDSASRPRPQKVHSRQHQSHKFRRKSLILYFDHVHKDSHRPQHDRQLLQPITYRRKSLILHKATWPRSQRFTREEFASCW